MDGEGQPVGSVSEEFSDGLPSVIFPTLLAIPDCVFGEEFCQGICVVGVITEATVTVLQLFNLFFIF